MNEIFIVESSLLFTYAEASQSYIMSRKQRWLSLNMQIFVITLAGEKEQILKAGTLLYACEKINEALIRDSSLDEKEF